MCYSWILELPILNAKICSFLLSYLFSESTIGFFGVFFVSLVLMDGGSERGR